jgi:hypothetical protein
MRKDNLKRQKRKDEGRNPNSESEDHGEENNDEFGSSDASHKNTNKR